MDLWEYNMIDVLRLLKRKEVSVRDYVRCLIDRCQEHQDLNVFISFNPEMVLSAAEKADGERMGGQTNIGPLHGIPIVLKDNIDIKNWPTSAGTPALKGHYPNENALIVSALLRAGAIPFGKANMHELAQGVTNNNAFFGACLNPFDRSKIPGGSSGGCSVAVAARLAPAAIGTDTGGSVRIPASLCGIVGFRPTVGRYPTKGIVPISHTRDTPGPMARSVADVSILDRVLSKDPEPMAPAVLKTVRLGVPRKPFYANLHSDTQTIIEAGLRRLENYGIELIDVDIPEIDILDRQAGFIIADYEMMPDLEVYLRDHCSNLSPSGIVKLIASPDVKRIMSSMIDHGEDFHIGYISALNQTRLHMQNSYWEYFYDHRLDGIVFPTTPLPATPIGVNDTIELNGVMAPLFQSFIRNTSPGSVAGIPGVNLFSGMTPEGLPVGMEIDGPFGSDRRLLAIGMAIEDMEPALPTPITSENCE